MQSLLAATCFYGIYYVTYKTRLRKHAAPVSRRPLFTINRVEANLTWVMLMVIALVSVSIFFMHNGFCCSACNPIARSSPVKCPVWHLSASLFLYSRNAGGLLLRQSAQAWLFFLVSTVAFGLLTYMIVGGTRANIIIAFAIFCLSALFAGGSRYGCWPLRVCLALSACSGWRLNATG